MSDGTLALYDCAKAQKVRSKQICSSAIKAIAFFNSSSNKLVISASDIHFVTIAPKLELLESLSPEKKRSKKKSDAPDLLKISPNDKHLLSADRKGNIHVKSLGNGEETKDEVNWTVAAHQDKITAIAFVNGQDDLVVTVSANTSDACSIWRIGIDQPSVILDRPTTMSPVFSIGSVKTGKSFTVSCVSAEQVSVYAFKEKKLSKQKVRTADSVVSLHSKAIN